MSLSLSLSRVVQTGCSLSLSSKQGKERRDDVNDVNDESVSSRSRLRARVAKRKRGAFFGAFCVCRFLVNGERTEKKKRMSHAELYIRIRVSHRAKPFDDDG